MRENEDADTGDTGFGIGFDLLRTRMSEDYDGIGTRGHVDCETAVTIMIRSMAEKSWPDGTPGGELRRR